MVRRDNREGNERTERRTADKSGDHLMKEREREEKRATGARERGRGFCERLRSGEMRGEWERPAGSGRGAKEGGVDRGRETEKASPQDGRKGEGRGERERDIPGARRRCARVEKRVRAAHYARDASRSSARGSERTKGSTRRDEARQATHRGRGGGGRTGREEEDRREEKA